MKTFKKLIISIFIFIFLSYFPTVILADDILNNEETEDFDFSEVSTTSSQEPITYSKHIVVLDRKTLSVLYEKDAYTKTAMASTTKIMTCILAIENFSLDTTVTISKNAASINGSTLGLNVNDSICVSDLLYGLMLRSGNDDSVA